MTECDTPTATAQSATAIRATATARRGTVAVVVAVLCLATLFALSTAAVGASAEPLPAISTQADDVDDDAVVVRLEDDHVVTAAGAEDMPEDPYVTDDGRGDGDTLEVVDGQVQTESGDDIVVVVDEDDDDETTNSVKVRSADPNLVVTDDNIVNDTLTVDDGGWVETTDGESEVVNEETGEQIGFPYHGEADYTVDITDVNHVGEGDTLEIETEFRNVGYDDSGEDQDVDIELYDDNDDLVSNTTEEIGLERGEAVTETLEYETEDGDSEASSVYVDMDVHGSSDSEDVSIEDSGTLVEITDWNQPATGDDLEVTAEVERFGVEPEGEQEYLIEFRIDGSLEETQSVDLDTGDVDFVTFTYETTSDDPPDVDVTVESGSDDEDTETLTILSDAALENNLRATLPVGDRNWPDEGEDLELGSVIEYVDDDVLPDEPQEYEYDLLVDGETVDSETVTLGPDETSAEPEFVYETEVGDAPRVEAELEGPGETDSTQPRVNGSGFEVSIDEVDSPVNESETFTAFVVIENTGDVSDEQDVVLRVDDAIGDDDRVSRDVVDNETVSLDPGEVTTERFSYRTGDEDVPLTEAAIISDDDEDTANVTVRDSEPRFDVSDISGEAVGDDEVEVSAAVNNTGLEPDEQHVEFVLDGDIVHIDRISLEPWEEQVVSGTVESPGDGDYDLSVVTDDVTEEEHNALSIGTADDDGDDIDDTDDADETDDDDESTEAPDDDGLPWYLVLLGVLGVLASVLVLLVYQNDPENFPPDAAALSELASRMATRTKVKVAVLTAAIKSGDPEAIAGALKGLIGLGAGMLVVQNELPRETVVRIRCQTADDTVLLQDLELGPDERRDLGSLPDTDQFKVGAGVEDITAHEEVFQSVTGDVGVVLRAEGILIANLS